MTRQRLFGSLALVGFLVLSAHPAARAQEPGEDAVQGETEELGPFDQQDHATEADRPTPPEGVTNEELEPDLARHAGVGSEVAYGSESVVELGGAIALTHQSDLTVFRLSPSIGYFIVDNLEITLFPGFAITHISPEGGEGETVWNVELMVEPSYHVPVSRAMYVFGGMGLGFTYAEDPGFEFALRPKVGVDLMVGRSGIFKPALFLDITTGDGVTRGGLEGSFTVMW